MELTVDESIDQKSISNPTWKEIEDGILRIDGQNSSFLILSAVNGNDHLQCVGNKIGLTVEYREYMNNSFKHFRLGNGTGQMQNAIYLLLDNLIGEEDVAKKIDWIDWVPLEEESKDSLLPLIEMRQLVASMD